jgi:prepilin-type N-terminal cleavage/methylation domain-containing protein
MKQKIHQSGFTIIEVLTVIAIIGILAAIVLMGVSGAQVNARNAETTTVVQAYKKALEKYLQYNGNYPPIMWGSCLGEGYGDYNGDGSAGDCWHIDPVWGVSKENPILHNALKPYMNNELPVAGKVLFNYAPYNQIGAILSISTETTLDGAPHKWFLAYTMEGNQTKCTVGQAVAFAPGGWPNFVSTPASTGYTEAYGTSSTGCWVPLPDPDKL